MSESSSSSINPLVVIETSIEMINDLIINYSKDNLEATRGFVFSIENILPTSLTIELYSLIANIEISHERKC